MNPLTESERLMASVILVFIVYFGLDSLLFLVTGDESASVVRYRLTFSFVVGMAAGILFYVYGHRPSPAEKSFSILEKTLSDDEMLMVTLVRDAPGLTQDSLRFRTDFSKSKVSALLLNLEKKGVIQREKSGKTYKVHLGEWVK